MALDHWYRVDSFSPTYTPNELFGIGALSDIIDTVDLIKYKGKRHVRFTFLELPSLNDIFELEQTLQTLVTFTKVQVDSSKALPIKKQGPHFKLSAHQKVFDKTLHKNAWARARAKKEKK